MSEKKKTTKQWQKPNVAEQQYIANASMKFKQRRFFPQTRTMFFNVDIAVVFGKKYKHFYVVLTFYNHFYSFFILHTHCTVVTIKKKSVYTFTKMAHVCLKHRLYDFSRPKSNNITFFPLKPIAKASRKKVLHVFPVNMRVHLSHTDDLGTNSQG